MSGAIPVGVQAAHAGAAPGNDDPIKRLVPWLVAVAFFMESLDTTILNTAVPTVAAALKIAPLSMKSVLSLAAAFFIPDRFRADASQIIHGIHRACVTLGALTILSTLLFRALKESDGQSVSQHDVSQHEVSLPAS